MRKTALLSTALVFCFVLGFSLPRQKSSPKENQEKPTPVQKGVMSQKQKAHSKLYEGRGGGKKLTDVPESLGDITVENGTPLKATMDNDPPFDPFQFLNDIASEADTIVIGTVKSKASQLTEDETYIFTDYQFDVEQVLKSGISPSPAEGEEIEVTRPGGEVSLKGRVLRAGDKNFDSFRLGGRYLLFLRQVPETGAYRAFSTGSFLLKGAEVVALNPAINLPASLKLDATAFNNSVRVAVATGSARPKAQEHSPRLQ